MIDRFTFARLVKRPFKMIDGEVIFTDGQPVGDISDAMEQARDVYTRRLVSRVVTELTDAKAKEMMYDNMQSVRAYCGYDNPFRSECLRIAEWADACWVVAGEIRGDVTEEDIAARMPRYGGDA